METILSFLRDNWQFVAEVGLSFIVLLIAIFKKRSHVEVPLSLFDGVPAMVLEAEEKFGSGHGKEKLQYVLTKWLSANRDLYGLNSIALKELVPSLIDRIELILEAPTKKKGE